METEIQKDQEKIIERLMAFYNKLEREGFITQQCKFLDITKNLEIFSNKSSYGLWFTIVHNGVSVNKEPRNLTMEFDSYENYRAFNFDEWLREVENII